MSTRKIGDLDLHYEVYGQGPSVVLIAGYTCDHKFWDDVVSALTGRYQIVLFDNRGIGRTRDDGEPFSIESMAADSAELIKYLGLSRPTVVGQSMGGAIVQAMLMHHSKSCGRCVILNSTQVFRPAATMALQNLLDLRKMDVDLDLLIDSTLPWVSGSEWLSKPENVADFKAALSKNPVPQSIPDQERQLAALKSFDARTWNKPWDHPTLVISAAEDVLALPSEGAALAASLGSEFIEIPGGHASPVEQPELITRILTDFLTSRIDAG